MKLIVLAAVISSTLVLAIENPNLSYQQEVRRREEEAAKYCNTIYPVTEDSRTKLGMMVAKGTTVPKTFNSTEWCNLHCNLEKLGFFDATGKMQVRKIFKYVLKTLPEIAPNSHTLLIHLFQIYRSTKDMEDKCSKAFVAYYRFADAVLISTLAVDLNANTNVRDAVMEKVLTGEELPAELQKDIEKYFNNTEAFFKETISNNSTITPTAVPSS